MSLIGPSMQEFEFSGQADTRMLTVFKLSQGQECHSQDMLEWYVEKYLDSFGFDSIHIVSMPFEGQSLHREKLIYSKSANKVSAQMFVNFEKWAILESLRTGFYPYYFQLRPPAEAVTASGHSVFEVEVRDSDERLFLTQVAAKFGFCAPLMTPEGNRAVAIMTRSKSDGDFQDGAAYMGILEIFDRMQNFASFKPNLTGELLNSRELECLKWVAAGKTSIEVAKITGLSEHTINHYLQVCCKKLDTVNRIQAVALAIRMNLI